MSALAGKQIRRRPRDESGQTPITPAVEVRYLRLRRRIMGEGFAGALGDYWLDAWNRSILFLDVLRERGNTYRDQQGKAVPHVLDFEAELVLDGRALPR